MPGCCLTLAIRDPEWVCEGWESKVLKETSTQDHPAHARLTYTTPRTPSFSLPHPRNSTLSIPIAAVPNPQPSRNREKCPPRRRPFTLPADGTLRPTRLSRFRNRPLHQREAGKRPTIDGGRRTSPKQITSLQESGYSLN